MDWRFILSLIFAVIVTVFAVQNAKSVEINFLYLHLSISQALVVLISAIVGAVTVFLLSIIRLLRLKIKMKDAGKTIIALEEENKKLKQALASKESLVNSSN